MRKYISTSSNVNSTHPKHPLSVHTTFQPHPKTSTKQSQSATMSSLSQAAARAPNHLPVRFVHREDPTL